MCWATAALRRPETLGCESFPCSDDSTAEFAATTTPFRSVVMMSPWTGFPERAPLSQRAIGGRVLYHRIHCFVNFVLGFAVNILGGL